MTIKLILSLVALTVLALGFCLMPLLKKKSWAMSVVIVLLLPLMAGSLYLYWGHSRALLDYLFRQQQAAVVKSALAKIKDPQQVVNQLVSYLQTHPNSPKGWYLLGKLYLSTENYAAAVNALNQAYSQSPNNDYATAYAQALFFNNEKQLTPAAQQILEKVLQTEPNNINANNLLAINAYNLGQYQQAITYWEKLIPLFDAQSNDEQVLLQMISRAQTQINKIPSPAPAGEGKNN